MLLCSLLIVEGGWRLPGPATGRSSSVTSELWSKACSSRGQSRKKNLNLNLKKYLNVKLDRCVILPSSPPDAEAVFPLCCHSGGDAELIHLHPSLWVDGLPASRAVRGEPPAVLNHLLPGVFTVWCSSGFFSLSLFLPPRLRSTDPSSTWCVSGAVSLALCSISVDAPYACASEPGVTQRSVNWTFPAPWGITCCCVTTGRSTDFTLCTHISQQRGASLETQLFYTTTIIRFCYFFETNACSCQLEIRFNGTVKWSSVSEIIINTVVLIFLFMYALFMLFIEKKKHTNILPNLRISFFYLTFSLVNPQKTDVDIWWICSTSF